MFARWLSWLGGAARSSLSLIRSRLLVLLSLTTTRAAAAGPRWDAKNGVWVGNRAASSAMDIPSPLWIFGYGSLCWRPDFAHETTMVGRVCGYQRFFAQRSCDHRGTPESPGLVATLLSDKELVALGVRDGDAKAPSTCVGICYLVGPDDVETVLANLDFREKGGYSRAVVQVQPSDGSPSVRALLYTGNSENPNFTPEPIRNVAAAAATIATAHGPSGPNRAYLEHLATWLQEVGEEDEHVAALMRHMPPR